MTTRNQDLMSTTAKTIFRLNGQLLAVGEDLARPVGLTAAWWQVLGAVLVEPRPVAAIAREVGVSRQSVQRIADLLVHRRLARYEPNPAHRRAKLLAPTELGKNAVRRISPRHRAFAERLVAVVGEHELASIADRLAALSRALDTLLKQPEAD